jgi:hypothetical protein
MRQLVLIAVCLSRPKLLFGTCALAMAVAAETDAMQPLKLQTLRSQMHVAFQMS